MYTNDPDRDERSKGSVKKNGSWTGGITIGVAAGFIEAIDMDIV